MRPTVMQCDGPQAALWIQHQNAKLPIYSVSSMCDEFTPCKTTVAYVVPPNAQDQVNP
jgi:hypothetical protein